MVVNTHRGKPPVREMLESHLIIFLLSVCLGMVVNRVAAQEVCEADAVVVAGGEKHTFTKVTDRSQMTLFGKLEDGFEGFSVNVEGTDGIGYSAWFPVEQECFPDQDTWYQLITFAQIKNNNSTTGIIFGFETRYCRRECEKDIVPQSLQKQQSVKIHGASQWSENFPQGDCNVARPLAKRFTGKLPTCSKSPTPMPTVTIIVIVMVALALLHQYWQ